MARELDLPITLHAGDGLWGLDQPIDQLQSRGLLGPRTTYVHCCTLSDHEFKLIADTGGSASLSAEVELNMGHGNPATLGCLKHGVRPSISIDVCTSVGGDMFTQIRVLMAATRGVVNAEALQERKLLDPVPLTRATCWISRRLQGAKTAGLDHRIGSLTPGKDADLVMLDTNALNMFPINNPVGAVVEDAHVGNVDSVFVRGPRGEAARQAGRRRHEGAAPTDGERRSTACSRGRASRVTGTGFPSPTPAERTPRPGAPGGKGLADAAL